MIVEPTRLMSPADADLSTPAPAPDGALPLGLAPVAPSPGAETPLGDFAATIGRLVAQGVELTGHDGDADAAQVASEAASQADDAVGDACADAPQGLGAGSAVGVPVVPVTSLIAPIALNVDGPSMAGDAVPVAPAVIVPDAGDSTRLVSNPIPGHGNEALRDAAAPHIATLLAAHAHRMRGALGSQALAERGQAAASALATSSDATVRAAVPMATTPVASPRLGASSPSLAQPLMAADKAAPTPGVASIDSGTTQALRAAFAPAVFGNAFVGESTAATVAALSGGQPIAQVVVGDGATVARTLAGHVHAMSENGVHEARLRLAPAELGDIGIVVRKSPMQLSVSLQVARPEALSLVQGTAALLRDMLSQRHAGEVHVSVGSLPSFGGHGTSDNARERHSRDEMSGDAAPGLALGEASREREAFRL